MTRVFLTGASGHIGRYLCAHAPAGTEIIAGHWQHPLPAAARGDAFDLTDRPRLREVLDKNRPEVIIHAAALPDVGRCEREPAYAEQVNVTATADLARWAADHGARMTYLSTDLVYGGSAPEGGYTPRDIPEPVSVYGRSKLAGERVVRGALGPAALVTRCALVYGWGPPWQPPFAEQLVTKLRNRETVRLFTDQYRTTIYTADLARSIWELVCRHAQGIWHLGGPERVSRYEFGCAVARQLGEASARYIEPITMGDMPGFAPRPADCAFATGPVRELVPIAGIADGVKRFLADEPPAS